MVGVGVGGLGAHTDPVQPVGGVTRPLQPAQTVGPGRGPRQPEHGQHGRHQEVHLRVPLLGVLVQGGVPHVNQETEKLAYKFN